MKLIYEPVKDYAEFIDYVLSIDKQDGIEEASTFLYEPVADYQAWYIRNPYKNHNCSHKIGFIVIKKFEDALFDKCALFKLLYYYEANFM